MPRDRLDALTDLARGAAEAVVSEYVDLLGHGVGANETWRAMANELMFMHVLDGLSAVNKSVQAGLAD